ncbi:MAG: hypothetical protein NXI00_23670, partial [Cytophagales bacterium]|nr:hypothetical protein [Cytophagales bacterium]
NGMFNSTLNNHFIEFERPYYNMDIAYSVSRSGRRSLFSELTNQTISFKTPDGSPILPQEAMQKVAILCNTSETMIRHHYNRASNSLNDVSLRNQITKQVAGEDISSRVAPPTDEQRLAFKTLCGGNVVSDLDPNFQPKTRHFVSILAFPRPRKYEFDH